MTAQSTRFTQQALSDFLWSLPQPIFVFGCTVLVASAVITQWMSAPLLVGLVLCLQLPLILLAERIAPKRQEWLLTGGDLAKDAFWVLTTYLVWVPLYDVYYDAPVASVFASLRETSGIPLQLQATTVSGLVVAAIVGSIAIEFIGYWAHRLQHRFLFLWRIHATHHHITKMSVARADRTHPLEFIGLNLGGAVALAFLGATPEVVLVTLTLRVTTGHVNHANLPLKSGVLGWVFNTAEWHQLQHSCDYAESNSNFGCTVILWDRVFGTFCGKTG